MLVGFMGTPSSGKTTCASKLFSFLKEKASLQTELIVEQARWYIANFKVENNLPYNEKIVLSDIDQLKIMERQYLVESILKKGTDPKAIIISDSCIFNAGLYISDEFYDKGIIDYFKSVLKHYDVLFYCHPIELKELPQDSNRIHNIDEINKANIRALNLLEKLSEGNTIKIHNLLGTLSLDERFRQSLNLVLEKNAELALKYTE
jgi:nicotinamide riboside kinase